ncbi:MAG: cob(I)yrinic acid a,c-diamide adenosyltransferase [Marinilabiliales bacterium]|nr:MAG: cob(I)yrinic acid a,c-diamide adenosyltransferase [Marinilabiliales bacterium]
MKIYTKTGDKGITSLIGGKRVPKYDDRIEAYGSVDELIAWTGLIRDHEAAFSVHDLLVEVQDRLMTCASILAADCDDCPNAIPSLCEDDIVILEKAIDEMEDQLEPLSSFILPGGHTVVSYCHIARNVCRRAERNVLRLDAVYAVDRFVIRYLNRLSDYFFVLSRKLGKDSGATEIPWEPRL